MKKAVVLFSGGLDSTTCLAYAKTQFDECHALSFSYSQKHAVELKAAEKICQTWNIPHKILQLNLEPLYNSALTNEKELVKDFENNSKIPATYVPARNTIFLSIALGFAEILDANAIVIGASSIDYSGYPDCRAEYLDAFQQLAFLATKKAVEDNQKIQIVAPLLYLSKAETIALGLRLHVEYSLTVSCYRATEEGLACGKCDSCHFRKKGFDELGIPDPTRYVR